MHYDAACDCRMILCTQKVLLLPSQTYGMLYYTSSFLILNGRVLYMHCHKVVICFLGFIYLFRFQDDNIIGGILDFSIATLSSFVLLFSVINDKLSDKAKYIFMDSLYILLTLVGFVIVLILGIRLKNPSTIGRTLSFICLFASLILEIKKVLHHNHDRNLKQEKKKQEEINNIEKSSIMSSQE